MKFFPHCRIFST